MQELLIVRGLPGAGKSTFAESLVGYKHFESDMWREISGTRVYSGEFNEIAHAWCLGMTADALARGCQKVVVSNVFHTLDRIKPYAVLRDNLCKMGHEVRMTVIHVQGPIGRSVYTGVSYDYYLKDWEEYKGEFD